MAESETEAPQVADYYEDRVDQRALEIFASMGFLEDSRLPDGLCEAYNNFKRVKDTVRPGPLTPEGYATVVSLYRLGEAIRELYE